MTKRPVIVDQRQADLAKIDREIARLSQQIVEKEAALEADVQKDISEMSHSLQQRLDKQIVTLGGRITKLHDERFVIELGDDLAEPKRRPAAAAAPAKQHREWDDLEPVQEPKYPTIARTAENQKTFAEAFDRLVAFSIHKKSQGLKAAGCHPDDRAHLDLVAIISAQGEASHHWLAYRCQAIEDRLKALEDRPALKYAGVWSPSIKYAPGEIVTHGGSSWHANISSTGLQPGEDNPASWTLMTKRGRDGKDARP